MTSGEQAVQTGQVTEGSRWETNNKKETHAVWSKSEKTKELEEERYSLVNKKKMEGGRKNKMLYKEVMFQIVRRQHF